MIPSSEGERCIACFCSVCSFFTPQFDLLCCMQKRPTHNSSLAFVLLPLPPPLAREKSKRFACFLNRASSLAAVHCPPAAAWMRQILGRPASSSVSPLCPLSRKHTHTHTHTHRPKSQIPLLRRAEEDIMSKVDLPKTS